MSRRLPLVLAAAVLIVAALGAWGYLTERDDASLARNRLASARATIRTLARREPGAEIARLKDIQLKMQRQLHSIDQILGVALRAPYMPRTRRSPVEGRRALFVPHDAWISKFRVIPQSTGAPPELVVHWNRGHLLATPVEMGIFVWEATRELRPGETLDDHDLRWRIAFSIDLPFFHDLPAWVGPTQGGWLGDPREQTAVQTYGDGLSFHLGDVTGDGHPEIVILDYSRGSGGCAIYRILSNDGEHLRQIFYRDHCEGEIRIIQDNMLRVHGAVYPKGCDAAHGCGSYTKVLRWNGSGWDLVSHHVHIDRQALRYYRHD